VSRRTVRDRWYAEVIRTRLVSGSCRELLAYLAVKHMSEIGHVKVPRREIAAALGIVEHRVTVRMGEAVKAGLLDRMAGGVNAQTVQYGARFPTSQGVVSRHPQVEVEVSGKRHPQNDTQESAPGCRDTAPIRARVTKRNHNNGAPSALERGSPEQHSGSLEQSAPRGPAPVLDAGSCEHPANVKTTTGKCALCIAAKYSRGCAA
jgi:hypothetical protein